MLRKKCDVLSAVVNKVTQSVQAAREKDPKVPEDLAKLVEEAQQSIAALLVDVPEGDMQKAREVVSVVNGADSAVQGSLAPSAPSKAATERLEALL